VVLMRELRFDMVMCDPGFICLAWAGIRKTDVLPVDEWLNRHENFDLVAKWCKENLGRSTRTSERWVIHRGEHRVYFYNADDATLFKLRWC
jgi:hypothetical protein